MEKKRRSRLKIVVWIVLVLILLTFGGFYIYTLDYYHADESAQNLVLISSSIETFDQYTVFQPTGGILRNIGIIFYPGGKVEDIAYAPFLSKLSAQGYTCVLVTMPFNLAVFDVKAADDVYALMPDIDSWYLMGHSLGGAMASSYVEGNEDNLNGLILLGAYPINDSPIPTIAIYGTEDIKLDLAKLEGVEQVVIQGGNHAYFGDYGEQEGDGTASITSEDQQTQAVDAIMEFIDNQE